MPEQEPPTAARPGRRTQAERRETTRRSLITAAAELITEKGITATSLAEIGERAGYSRASVNHQFGSKASLIEEVIAEVEVEFAASLATVDAASDGMAAVLALADAYVDLGSDAHSISRASVVLWAEAVVHPDLRADRAAADRHTRQGVASFLRMGIEDDSIRALDPDATATVVLGMLRGVMVQVVIDPSLMDRRALKNGLQESLTAMLAPI